MMITVQPQHRDDHTMMITVQPQHRDDHTMMITSPGGGCASRALQRGQGQGWEKIMLRYIKGIIIRGVTPSGPGLGESLGRDITGGDSIGSRYYRGRFRRVELLQGAISSGRDITGGGFVRSRYYRGRFRRVEILQGAIPSGRVITGGNFVGSRY